MIRNLPLANVISCWNRARVVLLATAGDGRPNVMTMSWHMMVEFEPPRVACVVSDGDYSFSALQATRECVIGIPAVQMAAKVVKIGNCSGRDVAKFEAFDLTAVPAEIVSAPLIGECFANLECKVVDSSLVKKYGLFVLEVVQAWIDPTQKNPNTIHHQGHGRFVVDGKRITLPSRMRCGPTARSSRQFRNLVGTFERPRSFSREMLRCRA